MTIIELNQQEILVVAGSDGFNSASIASTISVVSCVVLAIEGCERFAPPKSLFCNEGPISYLCSVVSALTFGFVRGNKTVEAFGKRPPFNIF